jgi:hypothetical protein
LALSASKVAGVSVAAAEAGDEGGDAEVVPFPSSPFGPGELVASDVPPTSFVMLLSPVGMREWLDVGRWVESPA